MWLAIGTPDLMQRLPAFHRPQTSVLYAGESLDRVAEGDQIAWPPARGTVMTVAGFEDAIAASVQIQVSATLSLPVVSLAAFAILKLFAWHDRKTSDTRLPSIYIG
jgi:predicted nucleotidyltransferase